MPLERAPSSVTCSTSTLAGGQHKKCRYICGLRISLGQLPRHTAGLCVVGESDAPHDTGAIRIGKGLVTSLALGGHGGSRHKRSRMGQQLLNTHSDSAMRKALAEAIKGDSAVLRTFLPYTLSRPRDAPVKTGPLQVHTMEELAQTSEAFSKELPRGRSRYRRRTNFLP